MNHRVANLGVILSMLLTILYIVDLGPYTTFAFTFVATPVLIVCIVFYYFREVIGEMRRKDVL
jgi:hypothetical protein